MTTIVNKAPNLYQIMDDLLNRVTAEGEYYTIKVIPYKIWISRSEKWIDVSQSSLDIPQRLITIEKHLNIFNIIQNIIYQLCVAEEYQNNSSDHTINIDNAKAHYFNLMIDYFKNNSDELLEAFGISPETSYAQLLDYFAEDSNYQNLIKEYDDHRNDQVSATGTEAKEGSTIEEI